MKKEIGRAALVAALLCAVAPGALAQSGGKVGAGSVAGAAPGQLSGTIASGGSGATTDAAASSIGAAGTATGAAGSGSSLVTGAAVPGDRTNSRAMVHDNNNNLIGQAKSMADEGGGDWSKSQTQIKPGAAPRTRTKGMEQEPGKSPTSQGVELNR